MKNICKGCSLNSSKSILCVFIRHDSEEKCPCIECLVKSMCKVPCEARYQVKIDLSLGDLSQHKSLYERMKKE